MKWLPDSDEFYIGYLPETAADTSAFLKRLVMTWSGLTVLLAVIIVLHQGGFSDSDFEYNKTTLVEGTLFTSPFNHLMLSDDRDTLRFKSKTLLLVGFGKHGASESLQKFESRVGKLDGKTVRLGGQLIYGEGKVLMQVDERISPEVINAQTGLPGRLQVLGTSALWGEVVDPKCYFGVMKPGEGKSHRSCAIRCIEGGIPPVFNVGKSDHYILLDDNLDQLNSAVASIVGDQMSLTGTVYSINGWKILALGEETINEIAAKSTFKKQLLTFEEGMTMCGH